MTADMGPDPYDSLPGFHALNRYDSNSSMCPFGQTKALNTTKKAKEHEETRKCHKWVKTFQQVRTNYLDVKHLGAVYILSIQYTVYIQEKKASSRIDYMRY